jgi:hypothetical protein
MAANRPTVITPTDVARALVEARDELSAARAALTLTRPTPAAGTAQRHVVAACGLLDTVQAAIVETWLRATGEQSRLDSELAHEYWGTAA